MSDQLIQLKKRIMRRVYFVFMLRNAAPLAFDCLVVVCIAFAATFFVSVRDVMVNLSTASASGGVARFSASALFETELSTKFLLLALGVVGFFSLRHLKRAVRAVRILREGSKESVKPLPSGGESL